MVFGLHLPGVFKRNLRIASALKRGEKIADRETQILDSIGLLSRTYKRLLDDAKRGKIRFELEKSYADIEKKEVIVPYLERLLSLLSSMKNIIGRLREFNLETIQNIEEINNLVIGRNNGDNSQQAVRGQYVPRFQETCQKMLNQRRAIDTLLGKILMDIDRMGETLKKGKKDVNVFNNDEVMRILEDENRSFFEDAKEELQILGIEANSFQGLMRLESLSELIYDREFFSKSRQARRIKIRNRSIRAIGAIYITFYAGLQVLAPALIGGIELNPDAAIRISKPAIHTALKQYTNENISFRAADGYLISGNLIKNMEHASTNKIIIFVHGKEANATQQEPYIKVLLSQTNNIDFFAINLRGFGPDSSKGIGKYYQNTTMGFQESLDVVGAINYLGSIGYNEVAVYGYSLGGAAVLNALGEHKDLISKNVQIKGVIVEKTFASADEFYRNLHTRFASNLGVEAGRAFVGKEYSKTLHAAPSELQWRAAKAILQIVNGYRLENNSPAESAKKIEAPLLAIGTNGGDIFMKPEYMQKIASSAPHGTALIVESEYKDATLGKKHTPEFDNLEVLSAMSLFVRQVF